MQIMMESEKSDLVARMKYQDMLNREAELKTRIAIEKGLDDRMAIIQDLLNQLQNSGVLNGVNGASIVQVIRGAWELSTSIATPLQKVAQSQRVIDSLKTILECSDTYEYGDDENDECFECNEPMIRCMCEEPNA